MCNAYKSGLVNMDTLLDQVRGNGIFFPLQAQQSPRSRCKPEKCEAGQQTQPATENTGPKTFLRVWQLYEGCFS